MLDGLFNIELRLRELDAAGDPLVRLKRAIDWEQFRRYTDSIREKERKTNAGRRAYDTILMFKILILQSLYNLSDDAMEYQIRDRISFMRFLGLSLGDRVPDAKTIWLFREQLREGELVEPLFALFDRYLNDHGFVAQKGQIIDASIVAAPRQGNTRKENETIKQGETPTEWEEKPAKLVQKDVDARWTKKNDVTHFGYKNHICVDVAHKLIREWAVTDAALHDSQIFEELIDDDNTRRELWADSAYRSQMSLEQLKQWGLREHLQRKGGGAQQAAQRARAAGQPHASADSCAGRACVRHAIDARGQPDHPHDRHRAGAM